MTGNAPGSSGPSRPAQLDALTGLRFFAAFFVLIHHAVVWTTPFTDSSALLTYAHIPSIYGMPLFFILSGFVIHYNYGKLFHEMRFRWAVTAFAGARFARLYPLFIFFLCVGLIVDRTLEWFNDDHGNWWFELVARNLTLTQSWFYSTIFDDRMVLSNAFGLGWSISTEVFFYVAFMFLVFPIARLRTPRQVILATAIFAAIAILVFATAIHFKAEIGQFAAAHLEGYIAEDKNWSESFIRWLFYFSPYARLPEFVMGCLMAQLYLVLKDRPVSTREGRFLDATACAALVVLILIGLVDFTDLSERARRYFSFFALNFLTAVPFATLIFCLARSPGVLSRALSAAPLVALGNISYSIYAVHTWTLRIFIREPVAYTGAMGIDAALRIGFGIVITLLLASATYRYIEVPARDWLRKRTANGLVRLYGSADQNRASIPTENILRTAAAMAGLVLLFAACVLYQFTIGL